MLRKLLLALFLLLPLSTAAQALDGDWNGTITIQSGAHLRVMFEFRSTADVLHATLVGVDQQGVRVLADTVALDGKSLTVALPGVNVIYQGQVSDDGTQITGTWTQNGKTYPLILEPGTIKPVLLHQPEPGDLTITTPTGTLAGTILKAGDGKLAAVIITGSGPANRDGNSTINGGRGTYLDIAKGLAAHGITTLRFDKRGIGESASALTRESDLKVQIYGDDVRAWAAELKRRVGAPCVWLVGHSEGALIAELAAANNPDICGIVTLAGVGRGFDVVLREQLERVLPAELKPQAFAIVESLKAGHPVADPPAKLMALFRPSVQPLTMSEFALDPAALLHALTVPVLIVQGDTDANVSVADAKALAAARPDATLKILPGVNHSQRVAKDDPGTGPGLLAPGEMDMVAEFLHEHSR
jgi:hypothetical protein